MKRRNFLRSFSAIFAIPLVGSAKESPKENVDRFKLSHQYPGAYHEPNDLFTPEEITEAGFVFVPYPSCIHRFDDPWHPIMSSYCEHDPNLLPVVMTSKRCSPSYIKTYDLDVGRRRGIESLPDYFRKKDIFKPMILEFMKKHEFHYVYRVSLGDSPCSWNGKFGDGDMIFHLYPVFVRGRRLPVKSLC